MNYKHYIVTRFNLPNKWVKDKFDNNILNDEWLENRYSLFENYCFPSVFNQSNTNFEWWVYFDIETPERFKNKNKEFSANFSNLKTKYEDSYQSFETNYLRDIHKEVKKEDLNYVITSRLDNDDIISCDFVDLIQKSKLDRTKILEFPIGLTLNIGIEKSLRKFDYKLNPFITLVYKVIDKNKIDGIYSKDHGAWSEFSSEIISEKPSWIQVIHEKNIYNTEKGKLILPKGLNNFKFNKPSFSFKYSLKIIMKKVKNIVKKTIKNVS